MDPKMTGRNIPVHRNYFFSFSRLKSGVMFLGACWACSSSHPFPGMPVQGPIFIAEVSVSFSQYLWPSEIQIQGKKKSSELSRIQFSIPELQFDNNSPWKKCKYDFCCRQEGEGVLRALILFDHFKAFPAETEMVKFCLKWAGCIYSQRDETNRFSLAWSSFPQTFMFIYLNSNTGLFIFCVAYLWIHPECFWFNHPVQGKKNQRDSSSFPQPAFSVLWC